MAHRADSAIDFSSTVYFGNGSQQSTVNGSSNGSPNLFHESCYNSSLPTNSGQMLSQHSQIFKQPSNGQITQSYSSRNIGENYGGIDSVFQMHSNNQSQTAQQFLTTSTPLKPANCSNSVYRTLEDYYKEAQNKGYIFGPQLDKVLLTFPRSNLVVNNRILSQFKNLYGEINSKTRGIYIQLGVRVPTKEHVSEIVGKGGNKIKELREKTGALIVTPNEQADHVFIIEGLPDVALSAANYIRMRAEEITLTKTVGDRRRASFGCNGQVFSNLVNYSGGTGGQSLLSSSLVGHRKNLLKDKISVPQDLVGKIIGTQGSIITTIQRDTGTEIRSPPKDATRDPKGCADFEIACYEGPQLTIDEARRRIYTAKQFIAHLVIRQFEKIDPDDDLPGSDSDWNRQCLVNGSDLASVIATHWRWPEIQPMPIDEARIVIDRILTESKSKTRRDSPDNSEQNNQLFYSDTIINRTVPNLYSTEGFSACNFFNSTISCDSDYSANSANHRLSSVNRMTASTSKALLMEEQNGLDIRHNSLGARFYSTSKSTDFNSIPQNFNSINVRSSIPECLEASNLDSCLAKMSLNNPSFSVPPTPHFKQPLSGGAIVRSNRLGAIQNHNPVRSNNLSNSNNNGNFQNSLPYHQIFNDSGFESLNSAQQQNYTNSQTINSITQGHVEEDFGNGENQVEISNLYNIFKFPDEDETISSQPIHISNSNHTESKSANYSTINENSTLNNIFNWQSPDFVKNNDGISIEAPSIGIEQDSIDWVVSSLQDNSEIHFSNKINYTSNCVVTNYNNNNVSINNNGTNINKIVGCIGDGRKKTPSPQ